MDNRDPTIHIKKCKERNILKKYPKCMHCGGYMLYLQHQVAWNKLPNKLYMGRNGKLEPNMSCSNGFKYRTGKNTCPTGYTYKNIKNRGCRRQNFKECTKKPQYDFSYTYHTVNPDNIDDYSNESLTYGPMDNTIYNLSCMENS